MISRTVHSKCLKSPRFDLAFVPGCALLALASGLVVVARPDWLPRILLLDVLLLGSQHVIATYTRICFDQESFRQHRFLVLGVPWIVLLGTFIVFASGGTVLLTSLYMYWQWFHYTGQAVTVERLYAHKAGWTERSLSRDTVLNILALYGVPLFGFLHRSLQKLRHPEEVYLTFNFHPLPVTEDLVAGTGLGAALLCVAWGYRQLQRYRDGDFSAPYAGYVVTHWIIFLTGYYLIYDITYGWLVLNVWHNLQYVLLVWMYNNNRYKKGVEPQAKALSYLSQTRFIGLYLLACIILAAVFYKVVEVIDGIILERLVVNQYSFLSMNPIFFQSSGLANLKLVPNSTGLAAAIAMISYQVINMHHYIVDAVVWRLDKKEYQAGLGLADE